MMDKQHSRRLSGKKLGILMMLVISMVFVGVYCLTGGDAVRVRADGNLQFYVGGSPKNNGETIDCITTSMSIMLLNAPTGSTFEWEVVEPSVIKIDDGSVNGSASFLTGNNSINIKRISPGYSGLTVTVTSPSGSQEAYIDVRVPLEWDDNNNIDAQPTNDNYGLMVVNGRKTVQIYKNDSNLVGSPNRYWHYLRKLKYIEYSYSGDDPDTAVNETLGTPADSDVNPSYLANFVSALEWESSDPNVAEVNEKGDVIAKSAGFATIKVKTKGEKYDEDSFDVVVVPEVTSITDEIRGYAPDTALTAADSDGARVVKDFEGSEIVVEVNAENAALLDWYVLSADGTMDITDTVRNDIQVSSNSKKFILKNIKAGTYFITAVPRNGISGYSQFPATSKINILKLKVIVPIKYPPSDIVLGFYSSGYHDTYNILEYSNLPSGVFNYEINYNEQQYARMGNSEGLVEAVSEGRATVRITKKNAEFNALFGSYATNNNLTNYNANNTVNVTVYGGVLLNSSLVSLPIGNQYKLELVAPENYLGQVNWSSDNPSRVSVDSSGRVTAIAEGEATVKVVLNDGTGVTRQAQCVVKVVNAINSISLSAGSDHISEGGSMPITATVDPSELTASALRWTVSDTSIAELVPTEGSVVTIIGRSPGTVAVTALNPDNGKIGTMVVTVNPVITGISVSPSSLTVARSSGPIQLFATCTPGLPANEVLTWTSDKENIARVDQTGKVTFGGDSGIVYITVRTENGKSATCTIVVTQEMQGIVLDKYEYTMYAGENYRLTYTIRPFNTTNATLRWTTSDANVATVDTTGLISAKNPGTCTITAQSTDGTGLVATCLITVIKNATGVKLDVNSLEINVGETYQLDAKIEPANSSASLYYESSNPNVAIVSSNGKITAKGKGNCVVFAKTGTGIYDYCYVEVSQQVTGLELDREEAEIKVGEMIELIAKVTPESASDLELEWTSKNEKVATVSQKGVVKGIAKGSTIISCTTLDGEYIAICLVTVTEADGPRTVTITVNKSATVGVKKSYQLTATVDGAEVDPSTLSWKSSNKKIAKVTKSGVIKGVAVGKCKITVKMKDGSIGSAKCTVKVITATNDIELNKTYVEIVQGRTLKLKATTSPKKTTYSPLWESSDETIATVSKKGTITALKPGDCTIKCVAKDNSEVYAVCRVHVTAPVTITSFNFSEEALVMVPGESSSVQYTVSPANYTEGYTWSSDNPVVATVDSKGKVTARAVGAARITALSDSGKKSTMNVYVVGLSKSKITLHQYESTKIKLEVDGVKSGELDIRWDTDNQSIAEMSNGKVTGKALGTTTVYCVVNGRYLACTVKVIKN